MDLNEKLLYNYNIMLNMAGEGILNDEDSYFENISRNYTVYFTFSRVRIIPPDEFMMLPEIAFKLSEGKVANIETLLDAAKLFNHKFIRESSQYYKRDDLFLGNKNESADSLREKELSNFKQLKTSTIPYSIPESSLLMFFDSTSNEDIDFSGSLFMNLYENNTNETILKNNSNEAILMIPIGEKETLEKIEKIYLSHFGYELSSRITVEENNFEGSYDFDENYYNSTYENESALSENKESYDEDIILSLFREKKDRINLSKASMFIDDVIENVRTNPNQGVIKSLEDKGHIAYIDSHKNMILYIESIKVNDEPYMKTTLYINNIDCNSKFDLLEELSLGSDNYFLEFEPILIDEFKKIIRTKRPFKNYIDAALSSASVSYKEHESDVAIDFMDFNNLSYNDIINIKSKEKVNLFDLENIDDIKENSEVIINYYTPEINDMTPLPKTAPINRKLIKLRKLISLENRN